MKTVLGTALVGASITLAVPAFAGDASASGKDGFRWRWGTHLAVGAAVPQTTPGAGIAARFGVQRKWLGLYGEVGLSGGIGGGQEAYDATRVTRASLFYLAHVTPMVEFDVAPNAFFGLGVVLGAGSWSRSYSAVAPDGTVRDDDTATANGFANALVGPDLRAGWRLGRGGRHLTIGLDLKLLGAATRRNYGLVAAGRPSATEVEGVGWALLPMVFIGYDFKK